MERFLEYWQACEQQEALHALTSEQIKGKFNTLTRTECSNGVLAKRELIAKYADKLVAISPLVALKEENIFIPCILLVNIDSHGTFRTITHLALPIIPNSVLEPAFPNPITLGFAEQFAKHFAVYPPTWLEDDCADVAWQDQLNYALEMLNDVNVAWQQDLTNQKYVLQEDAIIFCVEDIISKNTACDFDLSILTKQNAITIVDAQIGANTSSYVKNLIINAWVDAAIKQADPPRYVWLQPNTTTIKYATIFDCFEVEPFADADPLVTKQLLQAYDIYLQARQVLRNVQDITTRNLEKYADKGGIDARLAQLQNGLKEAKANQRHLEVLMSIWERQKELLVGWASMFDFVPLMQRNRLNRLYSFFKQNFPQDNVNGLSQAELEELLADKCRRAMTTVRMIADALHQVENDKHQEQIVTEKCLLFAQEQLPDIKISTIQAITSYLHDTMWADVTKLAISYWQQDFSAKCGLNGFCTNEPAEIDLLIIEHAEYVSPMQSIELIARARKLQVVGTYNAMVVPRFSVAIDYELTKHYGISENDADFEDLQFDGVLGSVGNTWNLLTKDMEANLILEAETRSLEYEFINTEFPSQKYAGSLINQGSVDAALDWLKNNPAQRDVIIYTCFSAQANITRKALASTAYANIPIKMLQEPNFVSSQVSLFLPVHAYPDKGPYVFDNGMEMYDQLQANTLSKIIVIGDKRLFKPELHSASGNFAKLFNFATNNHITITTEVNCV